MKTCTRCHIVKSYELFYKQAVNSKDGYQAHCRACDNARKKNWALKNPELAAAHRKTSDINRYKNYKSKVQEKNKNWKSNNPSKVSAMDAKRRAAVNLRKPSWFTDEDNWMVEQAYELAQLRTQVFGFQWHVDHVIPLQGKLVSGLHTPYNLQVIPASENLSKSNQFTVT
jgi:hypothetical protein